ncbi:MAG: hypothetical protein ACOVMN_01270 [Flexibacteraceae bacterium]
MSQDLKVAFGNQEELFPLDFNAFTISNIQCLGFELKGDNTQLGFEFEKQPIFLAINSKFNENLKPSRVAGFDYQLELVLNLEMKLGKNDQDAPTSEAKFSFLYQFDLQDLGNYFKANNQADTLSIISLANLAGLAYSTTRGLVLSYLERSIFKGYILPVVNPFSLVIGT